MNGVAHVDEIGRGVPPPHDDAAERIVLAALMTEGPHRIAELDGLAASDFYSGAHRRMFAAFVAVASTCSTGGELVADAARELVRAGRLEEVGGVEAMTAIALKERAVANLRKYADRLRLMSRARRSQAALRARLAETFTREPEDWPDDLFVDDIEPTPTAELGTSALTGRELGKALAPLDYFVRELAMPSGPGAPHCFGGYGYSGKSVAAQALLLALAANAAVWGVYSGPSRSLRVSHVDNEQGIALTQRRYQRLAAAGDLDLEDVGDHLRVFVFPKLSSGKRLVLCDAHRAAWAELMTDRDLLLVDSFAASRGTEVRENDSEVRRAIDLLGELSEETRCRALLLHHAIKTGDERGERDERMSLRGSGGIFDACDAVYLLSGSRGEAVKVTQIKARSHGEPVADLALVIEDVERDGDKRWGLAVRVAGVELIAEQREKKAEVAAAVQSARAVDRIRKALADGRRMSRTELVSAARLSGRAFPAAWRVLEEAGEGVVERVKEGRTYTNFHRLGGPKS